MEKITVWVRNLTKNVDVELKLPMEEIEKTINPNDEYIIIDSERIDVGEYESIYRLNNFLLECKENGINFEDLCILSRIMYFHEVVDAVENGSYIIVDFDAETSHWLFGRGGDITSAFDKGMCLYDGGYYNPFNFEMTDSIHCWIDWEAVWRDANVSGWHTVTINGDGYLLHK